MEEQNREITILHRSWVFRVFSEILFHIVLTAQTIAYVLLFQISVKGRAHIPRDKKVIFISNHIHYLDPGFVAHAIWPRRTYFTGLEETFSGNPFFSIFIRALGGIPIPKERPGRIVREIGDILNHTNRYIHIFPEGKMHRNHMSLLSFENGSFSLSHFFDTPIVPITEIKKPRRFWPAPKIIMVIGEPVDPAAYRKRFSTKEEALQQMQDDIRKSMLDTINLYFD